MTETQYETRQTPMTRPRRGGTVGTPLPGCRAQDLRSRKPERTLPQGDIGRRRSARANVFQGLLAKLPEKNTPQKLREDGFFSSPENLGLIDDHGLCQMRRTRGKDLIHLGAATISIPKKSNRCLTIKPACWKPR